MIIQYQYSHGIIIAYLKFKNSNFGEVIKFNICTAVFMYILFSLSYFNCKSYMLME